MRQCIYLAGKRLCGGRTDSRKVARSRRRDRGHAIAASRSGRRIHSDHGGRKMIGFQTLFYKEVLRFWKVATQTLTAPIVTAMLYLLIFGHVLEEHVQVYPGVRYTAFLIPGLVMMSVLQN